MVIFHSYVSLPEGIYHNYQSYQHQMITINSSNLYHCNYIYIYITINIRYHHKNKKKTPIPSVSHLRSSQVLNLIRRRQNSALDTSSNSPALTERESTRPRPLEGNRTWEVMRKPWRLEDIFWDVGNLFGDPDVLFWKMEVLYRTLIILPPD